MFDHDTDSITGFDVVPAIIDKMNDAGIKCYHPDDCPSDLNADIVLLSVPTPLIRETQRLDMKVILAKIKVYLFFRLKCMIGYCHDAAFYVIFLFDLVFPNTD